MDEELRGGELTRHWAVEVIEGIAGFAVGLYVPLVVSTWFEDHVTHRTNQASSAGLYVPVIALAVIQLVRRNRRIPLWVALIVGAVLGAAVTVISARLMIDP